MDQRFLAEAAPTVSGNFRLLLSLHLRKERQRDFKNRPSLRPLGQLNIFCGLTFERRTVQQIKMAGFIFVSFLFGSFGLVNMDTIFMNDDVTGILYKCETSTSWIKGCRLYDFSASNCWPWRLSSCPDPYVELKLSPCKAFKCEVNF